MADKIQYSPSELRAQADKLEAEQALPNKGKVFIYKHDGGARIHAGTTADQFHIEFCDCREATEAEIHALRIIPEFAAKLNEVQK